MIGGLLYTLVVCSKYVKDVINIWASSDNGNTLLLHRRNTSSTLVLSTREVQLDVKTGIGSAPTI